MQWGDANQDRSAQAVTTGLWDDASEFVGGLSPYTTVMGGSAMAWSSSVGNAEATLTMVDTDTNAVTITNTGADSGDISSYWVCLGPGQYGQLSSLALVSGDYVLAPNEEVTFTFPLIATENADGAGGLGLFSTNTFGSTDPSIYVDFMQWGDANQDRSQQAVDTGIWGDAQDFISCPSPYITTTGGSAFAWGEATAVAITIDVEATNALGEATTVIDNDTSATIIVGDAIANPIIVQHENTAEGLVFNYVITSNDADNTILEITSSSTIDVEGLEAGTCRIWGWSYRDINQEDFIGLPLQMLDDEDCSAISENAIEVIKDEALSVAGANLEVTLNVFPNPASDFINIVTNGQGSTYTGAVYSTTGSLVKRVSLTTKESVLQISEFSNGIYFLQLVDDTTGITAIKRFAKN